MGLVSIPNTFSAGELIIAAEHNQNFNTIYSEFNGNISNVNISDTAGIVDTKLATITTLAKVNVTSIIAASQSAGDLLYAAGTTSWNRLPAGTTSQVLIGGTTPSWGNIPPNAQTNGTVLQVVNTQNGAVATGNGTYTINSDSIFTSSDGDEYMTLSITPNSSTNKLKIDVVFFGTTNATGQIVVALLMDSNVNALAVGFNQGTKSSELGPTFFTHFMTAPDTSPHTFKVRAAADSGTLTFNGRIGGRLGGGIMASSITITEIKAS